MIVIGCKKRKIINWGIDYSGGIFLSEITVGANIER